MQAQGIENWFEQNVCNALKLQLTEVTTKFDPWTTWCNSILYSNIFVSSHIMYPENSEWIRAIVGSVNMGYDIYPTLSGLELATCSRPKRTPIILSWSDGL